MASNNQNQLSEQQVVDCDNRNSGCNGGWYDTAWQYMMEEGGIETSYDYPYTGRGGSCKADSNKFECTVTGCVGGPNNGVCDNSGLVGDEEELKKMLNDRAVAVAVDATPFQFYSSGILDCRNFHSLNHAVFAVGYEDGSHSPSRTVGVHLGENRGLSELEWVETHVVLLIIPVTPLQNRIVVFYMYAFLGIRGLNSFFMNKIIIIGLF